MLPSSKDPQHEVKEEPQCPKEGRTVSNVQDVARALPKQRARQMSKAERRRLAEAEEREFLKQQKRERMMKNVKQGGWIAVTAALIIILSVALVWLL